MPDSHSAVVRSSRSLRRNLLNWLGIDSGLSAKSDRSASSNAPRRASVPRSMLLEPLENRQLMSVVYLSSSSGKDTNSGLTPSAPVASIAKAAKLTKAGDTLLLKSGDTWNQGLGIWSKSNVTISSYGTGAKPKINSFDDGIAIVFASNFTVRGLSFEGLNRTNRYGIVTTGRNGNITIDSCDITKYRFNINLQGYYGAINGAKILNSTVTWSNNGGISSGIYAEKVIGLTISNTLVDHNGGTGSIFNHGAYLTSSCDKVVVTGCTFSNNSATGMQARAGGIITGNTFINNSIGLTVGLVNGGGVHKDGGVTCTVNNNTFSGHGLGLNTGYGVQLGNIKSGTVIGNKFINGPKLKYGYPITLNKGNSAGKVVGINNLTITGNTASNWGSHEIYVAPNAGMHSTVKIFGNSL